MTTHIFTLRPVEHGGVATITITDEEAEQSPRLAEVRDALAAHYAKGTPAPFGINLMGRIIGEPSYANVVGYEQLSDV